MTRSAFALWLAVVAAEGVALAMAVRRVFRRGQEAEFAPHPPSIHERLRELVSAPKGGDPDLRPIVALLAFAVAEDIAVRLLIDLVINPAPRPLHGLARAAYHLADALVMAWPLGLAWACWRVFVSKSSCFAASSERLKREGFDPHGAKTAIRPLDVLAAVYVGTVASLVSLHPLGASRTQWLLLAWEVVALAFAGAAIVLGWRRAVGGAATWSVAHGVLLVLVPVEAAVCAIGPFARPSVFSAWEVARWQYLAAFAIVAGMLGRKGRPE